MLRTAQEFFFYTHKQKDYVPFIVATINEKLSTKTKRLYPKLLSSALLKSPHHTILFLSPGKIVAEVINEAPITGCGP